MLCVSVRVVLHNSRRRVEISLSLFRCLSNAKPDPSDFSSRISRSTPRASFTAGRLSLQAGVRSRRSRRRRGRVGREGGEAVRTTRFTRCSASGHAECRESERRREDSRRGVERGRGIRWALKGGLSRLTANGPDYLMALRVMGQERRGADLRSRFVCSSVFGSVYKSSREPVE